MRQTKDLLRTSSEDLTGDHHSLDSEHLRRRLGLKHAQCAYTMFYARFVAAAPFSVILNAFLVVAR